MERYYLVSWSLLEETNGFSGDWIAKFNCNLVSFQCSCSSVKNLEK